MARRSQRHAPEPLSRLLARSDALTRELARVRERLAELEARLADEEPSERPGERASSEIVRIPETGEPEGPPRERDVTDLQRAARRRLSDER